MLLKSGGTSGGRRVNFRSASTIHTRFRNSSVRDSGIEYRLRRNTHTTSSTISSAMAKCKLREELLDREWSEAGPRPRCSSSRGGGSTTTNRLRSLGKHSVKRRSARRQAALKGDHNALHGVQYQAKLFRLISDNRGNHDKLCPSYAVDVVSGRLHSRLNDVPPNVLK